MPDEIKIVGAGFGRTGTMSLKIALEKLDFGPCYHMTEVFAHPEHVDFWLAAWRREQADWDGTLGDYRATLDWPACTFYEEILDRNPGAKVILTVRDPERWYESTRTTIYTLSKVVTRSLSLRALFAIRRLISSSRIRGGNLADELIWEGTFDGRFEEKAYAMDVFERHNAEVRSRILPDRLLVYDVKEGWEPLCEFLDVELPEEPFPHLNDAAEIRHRVRIVRAISLIPYLLLASLGILTFVLLRRRTNS